MAGTDSHERMLVGYTESRINSSFVVGAAHAWTLLDVDPNNITEDSIMDALRSRKSSFVSDSIRRLTRLTNLYIR